MIDAKELRIGNRVAEGVVDSVCSTGEGHAECYIDGSLLYDVNPIPLTSDILIACGFENKRDKQQIEYLSIPVYNGIPDSEILFYPDNGLQAAGLFCRAQMIGQNIYHLHQLQNLYFALTGKELEYKIKQ